MDFFGPWEQFLAAPFFNAPPASPDDVERIAIVGLAAGTTALQATHVYGPVPIDGFEIDPEIIRVGREYFDMNIPNLNAIPQDGRWGLAHSPYQYSIIGVDAYRPPYIPWHLTTVEFFQIVYQHLTEEGVVVINVGVSPDDRRLVEALSATIGQVFPSVYTMNVPGSFNAMIYGTKQATQFENLETNYVTLNESGGVSPLLLASIQRVIANRQPIPDHGVVFVDDKAPIEWITNTMVLGFVFSDGVESLP
jgi:hypothetical protein